MSGPSTVLDSDNTISSWDVAATSEHELGSWFFCHGADCQELLGGWTILIYVNVEIHDDRTECI